MPTASTSRLLDLDLVTDTPKDVSPPTRRVPRALMPSAYAALGIALLWSRLVGLGHSLWFDELVFVDHFVRRGPDVIIAGPDLSHEFYGVLAWAVTGLVGESEEALRLLSVGPFLAGVAIVAWWLHRRVDPLSGLLYVFLATVSPLLLDISRQARGYGIAFFAMSIVIVAALEAKGTRRNVAIGAMCLAGVLGTWTLPQLGIAFFGTVLVLLSDRDLRKPTLVGLAVSGLAVIAWYAPHVGQVHAAAQLDAGFRISTAWLITAPIDQLLIPALIWIDGVALIAGVIWLPLVIVAAFVMGSSPLLRERQSALILCSGVLATIAVLWLDQAYVFTRYLSYLLVPSFMLVASGTAAILTHGRSSRPAVVRSLICVVVIGVLTFRFATIAPDVVRLPREANRDVAQTIEKRAARGTPVFVYTRLPEGVSFYLDRPIRALDRSDVVARVCLATQPVVYVYQPMAIEPVRVPCLSRPGVDHYRFRQYARGGEMDVWLVPPAS
jgi:hypothetical protein